MVGCHALVEVVCHSAWGKMTRGGDGLEVIDEGFIVRTLMAWVPTEVSQRCHGAFRVVHESTISAF